MNKSVVKDPTSSTQRLSNNYSPQFLEALQIGFGSKEFLSQGGYESVDIMFGSMDLNHKKILDIGSGFGGVDIYLAEQFDAEIVGVDIEPYMIETSEKFLKKHTPSLRGKVSFRVLLQPCSLEEFEDDFFDIVFSKGTFYNIPRADKQPYLFEIYRKLKPGGALVISDWFQNSPVAGEALKRAATNDKICQFITPDRFREILEATSFQEIVYSDQCEKHIQYSREDCQRFAERADFISEKFGEEAYKNMLRGWKYWLEAQEVGELIAGIYYARKSSENKAREQSHFARKK